MPILDSGLIEVKSHWSYTRYEGPSYAYPNSEFCKSVCEKLKLMLDSINVSNSLVVTTDTVPADGTYVSTSTSYVGTLIIKNKIGLNFDGINGTSGSTNNGDQFKHSFIKVLYSYGSSSNSVINNVSSSNRYISDPLFTVYKEESFYYRIKIIYNANNICIIIYNPSLTNSQTITGYVISIVEADYVLGTGSTLLCNMNQMSDSQIPEFTRWFKCNENTTAEVINTYADLKSESTNNTMRVMDAYSSDFSMKFKNLYVTSDSVRGFIQDSSNNSYICFGKVMFKY